MGVNHAAVGTDQDQLSRLVGCHKQCNAKLLEDSGKVCGMQTPQRWERIVGWVVPQISRSTTSSQGGQQPAQAE